MALEAFVQSLLEHLPAVITVTIMSALLLKFAWKDKQKKRNFSDKSIFITSCDSVLGFDVAKRMDKLGFEVFAGFIMADGEAALRLKARTSNRLQTVEIDVTDDNQVRNAVKHVDSALKTPGLHCLINTAGLTLSGKFQWYTPSQCQRLMDVNIVGTIRATKYFLRLLKRGGRIINITGTSGTYDYPLLSVQSASKSAVNRFSKLLHQELEKMGVTVSTVEHEDGIPFTTNLTEKEDVHEMRVEMDEGNAEGIHTEEMYMWHRYQDAKAKRSLKAEDDFLKTELELIEHAITSHSPKIHYSPLPRSREILASLLPYLPRCARSLISEPSYVYKERK